MAPESRQKMLESAIELFRQHGYDGTGFRDVVAHSGAPRGSIYHYFPEGKVQLGIEAVTLAGDLIDSVIKASLEDARDFVAAFKAVWSWWIDYIEASGFAGGCPIAGVAAESHPDAPALQAAARGAFDKWQTTISHALRSSGMTRTESRNYAVLIVASLEGATLLARAAGDREPLDHVGRQIATLLKERLPATG